MKSLKKNALDRFPNTSNFIKNTPLRVAGKLNSLLSGNRCSTVARMKDSNAAITLLEK